MAILHGSFLHKPPSHLIDTELASIKTQKSNCFPRDERHLDVFEAVVPGRLSLLFRDSGNRPTPNSTKIVEYGELLGEYLLPGLWNRQCPQRNRQWIDFG